MNDQPTPDRPVALDDTDDLTEFVETHSLALVQFYTDGCGICQSMEPVLGGVARGTDAAVATINPRNDPELIEEYQITSVPTLVLFVDGEPVDRLADGFVPGDDLMAFVSDGAASV